ncbi:MAG: putative deacetylase [Deltaproteobacteria bacterium]|nr:putative deacetylase [Deltaproteobacteria bacterium]
MARFDPDYVPASAMAIYAHPDDIEFTIAGTVAKWADAGCDVTFVLITSGDAGTHDTKFTRKSLARVREREEREAARILGASRVVFLRKHDCELEPSMSLRKELIRQIRRHRPQVVLCNDPQALFFGNQYINHPDHLAAGKLALEAVFPGSEMELLWPGLGKAHKVHAVYVSSTHHPDTWIDIGGTIERKIASLKAHKSQLGDRDISPMIYEWARGEGRLADAWKAAGKGRARRPKYAEAFRIMRLLKDEPTGGGK